MLAGNRDLRGVGQELKARSSTQRCKGSRANSMLPANSTRGLLSARSARRTQRWREQRAFHPAPPPPTGSRQRGRPPLPQALPGVPLHPPLPSGRPSVTSFPLQGQPGHFAGTAFHLGAGRGASAQRAASRPTPSPGPGRPQARALLFEPAPRAPSAFPPRRPSPHPAEHVLPPARSASPPPRVGAGPTPGSVPHPHRKHS